MALTDEQEELLRNTILEMVNDENFLNTANNVMKRTLLNWEVMKEATTKKMIPMWGRRNLLGRVVSPVVATPQEREYADMFLREQGYKFL